MNLFHPQQATTDSDCSRWWRLKDYGFLRTNRELLLVRRKQEWYWKLTHLKGKGDGPVTPSSDLDHLLCLLVGGLVPVGVVADRWDDEGHPHTVSAFWREWAEHEAWSQTAQPIAERGRKDA